MTYQWCCHNKTTSDPPERANLHMCVWPSPPVWRLWNFLWPNTTTHQSHWWGLVLKTRTGSSGILWFKSRPECKDLKNKKAIFVASCIFDSCMFDKMLDELYEEKFMQNTDVHTRSHSFINVGNLVHLILKQQQQCRNAAFARQSYLALHNLPDWCLHSKQKYIYIYIGKHTSTKEWSVHVKTEKRQKRSIEVLVLKQRQFNFHGSFF